MVSISRAAISLVCTASESIVQRLHDTVLYHQPEKMKSKEDLEARKENLEQLKRQHGIE